MSKKRVLIGLALVGIMTLGVATADAGWGHRGHRAYVVSYAPAVSWYSPTLLRGACCGPRWSGFRSSYLSSCRTGCFSSRYTPCRTGCFDSCGTRWNSCGWTGVRAISPCSIFSRRGCCNSCSTSCTSYDPCCSSCSSYTSNDTGCNGCSADFEGEAGIEMSPSDALPTPANQPLPQAGTPNDPTTWNRNGTGILTLCVPEDATVTINGLVTSTQGTVRQYASHGLKPGQAYTYNIQVQLIRNGRLVNELRSVELSSGHTERLVFNDHASDIREIASR